MGRLPTLIWIRCRGELGELAYALFHQRRRDVGEIQDQDVDDQLLCTEHVFAITQATPHEQDQSNEDSNVFMSAYACIRNAADI